tara:strand:- start:1 stop:246 length:246 start_codon:yes stop_codon:yes gene_type:complete
MDYEFIEEQIEATKSDLVFHEKSLTEARATQEGLEVLSLVSDVKDKLLQEAIDNVKWYNKRIDHDHKMLDVLYSARDLTKK